MLNSSPLSVAQMNDDPSSLKWYGSIISRHIGTILEIECGTPECLLDQLSKKCHLDAIIIDAEYQSLDLPLGILIAQLAATFPDTAILTLSLYGDRETIDQAINNGARGFLLKKEIGMAIVAAVTMACRGYFVFTPSVEQILRAANGGLPLRAKKIRRWRPNPRLTPRVAEAFNHRVLHGMRAPLAAEEMGVEPETVERYVNQAYRIVEDIWADDKTLQGLDMDSISPEDRAFHWYTLPPRFD